MSATKISIRKDQLGSKPGPTPKPRPASSDSDSGSEDERFDSEELESDESEPEELESDATEEDESEQSDEDRAEESSPAEQDPHEQLLAKRTRGFRPKLSSQEAEEAVHLQAALRRKVYSSEEAQGLAHRGGTDPQKERNR